MKTSIHDFGGYQFRALLARAMAADGHDGAYLFEGIKTRARVTAQHGVSDLGGPGSVRAELSTFETAA